jgi:hypothetical protein
MNKGMKIGFLVVTFAGLVVPASPSRADRPDGPGAPAPARSVVRKPPGIGRDGHHRPVRVAERTLYRATCRTGSDRHHPWFGDAKDLDGAYRDARRHEREHRGHEAGLEVIGKETPRHPDPRDPWHPWHPVVIPNKVKDRHVYVGRPIPDRIVPPGR